MAYEIFVRSFADSNGDGVGDLPGIISRVPYLVALGIDAVWLSPFYPSALADGFSRAMFACAAIAAAGAAIGYSTVRQAAP